VADRLPRGVSGPHHNNPSRPYQARLQQGGVRRSLGYFATVQEAAEALRVARSTQREASAPAPDADGQPEAAEHAGVSVVPAHTKGT
jgi:hypothetical protein